MLLDFENVGKRSPNVLKLCIYLLRAKSFMTELLLEEDISINLLYRMMDSSSEIVYLNF